MKKLIAVLLSGVSVCCFEMISFAEGLTKTSAGEKLFVQHCAACHPQGGNIINPKKTLSKKDREANTIKAEEDVIKILRNGAPGMTKFDAAAIADKDAKEIAHYILKTFNK